MSIFKNGLLASVLTLGVLVSGLSIALADPTGRYRVEGQTPSSGGTYSGTVHVVRSGDVYQVEWVIAGERFTGTGLGGRIVGKSFMVGPANPEDVAISIGYISGNSFGMAFYNLERDGSWSGVWTYGGSTSASTERWIPMN